MKLEEIKSSLEEHGVIIRDLFLLFEYGDLLKKSESKFWGPHIINRLDDFQLQKLISSHVKEILFGENDLKVDFFKEFKRRLEIFNDKFAEIKLMEVFLSDIYFDFKEFPLDLMEEFFYIFINIFRKFNWQCQNIHHKEWVYDSDFWDHEFKNIIGKSLSQFIKEEMENSLKKKNFDEFIFLFQTFDCFEGLEYRDLLDLINNSKREITEFLQYIGDDIYYDGIKSVMEGYLKNLGNHTYSNNFK